MHRNVPYLKQQALEKQTVVVALLNNTCTTYITLICCLIGLGYLFSFSETAVGLLCITPGYILNSEFRIWTAFTFCFIELHFWEVVVDVITVGLCGKMLEPLWGQLEMFKFFGFCNFFGVSLTIIYYLFYYMVTKNPTILFDVRIHGLAGYVAGISVAVRQIMPDAIIFKTRYGRLTNRNVPLMVLVVSIILWSVSLLDGTYATMFGSGCVCSWIYLRFYQWHGDRRGDSSESFTFASFFPNVMQPVIGMLFNPIYFCCLKVGIIKQPAARSVSTSGLSSVALNIPGDPNDIERRRQIALKALSERLRSTDSSRVNVLPKSFPTLNNQYHQHGHGHHNCHQKKMTSAFLSTNVEDSNHLRAPITSARAEPRMITTMTSVAIPMPAPPPKELDVKADVVAQQGELNKELLIDLGDCEAGSSLSKI